jgi:hypothetical protein
MQLLRSSRWLLLGLLLSLFPASSNAGVFVSVGFAPPVLPVYEQPPCPQEGWMWTPGYWAYGDDGYYWVPGTWVPAPYEGALWTPPYWGWSSGLYVFHPGYWGRHVGYYGGVNYGFGYLGIGFVGGRWHDHDFEYNRAYMHVDDRRFHHVYEDRHDEGRYMVDRGSHVAYSGGPGGIHHDPGADERAAMREQHRGMTSFQMQHVDAARNDRNSYFNSNHGRPANVAVERPMAPQVRGNSDAMREGRQGSVYNNGNNRGNANPGYNRGNANPGYNNRGNVNPGYQEQNRNMPAQRPAPQYQNREQQYHPAPQNQPRVNENRPQPRDNYQPRPQPREERQQNAQPREQHQSRPETKDHKHD